MAYNNYIKKITPKNEPAIGAPIASPRALKLRKILIDHLLNHNGLGETKWYLLMQLDVMVNLLVLLGATPDQMAFAKATHYTQYCGNCNRDAQYEFLKYVRSIKDQLDFDENSATFKYFINNFRASEQFAFHERNLRKWKGIEETTPKLTNTHTTRSIASNILSEFDLEDL